MKRIWKIGGIAMLVAILGVAAVGAVAFAQDDDGSPFDFGQKFREAIADILDISVEKYDAAVEQAQEQVLDEALAEGWLTEDQAERMQERMEQGFGVPGMGREFMGPRGGHMGPGKGLMGHGGDSLLGVAAEMLDLSVEDLFAQLDEGKSIADIATENGVDPQDIADTYLGQLEENLKQAVDDGNLTQTQADSMLEQANEKVPEQLEGTWEGRFPGRFPGGERPGHPWGFPDDTDA